MAQMTPRAAPSTLATPQPGAASLITPSAAKRTAGEASLAPSSKRQSVDTPTDLERRRLRDEAWEAKNEVQEVRARCERESQAARLALLEEKQHVKELELQRDFLTASEARLREQTAELRGLLQSEQDARQREANEAREAQRALRDEMLDEASRQRESHRQRLAQYQTELADVSSARAAAEAGAGTLGRTPGTADRDRPETERALASAREEAASLRRQLDAATRRLDSCAEAEKCHASLRAQVAASCEAEHSARSLQLEVDRLKREASTSASVAADTEQLRKQLAASERAAVEHTSLRERYEKLDEQLAGWRALFAAEALGDGEEGAAACAAQVKERLGALRAKHSEAEGALRAAQAEASQLRVAASGKDAEIATARAEADSAAARIAALEGEVAQGERRIGVLSAQCDGRQRLLTAMEEDREKVKQRAASGGAAAAESAESGAESGVVAARLEEVRGQLAVREKHAADLEAQIAISAAEIAKWRTAASEAERSAAAAIFASNEAAARLRIAEAERDATRAQPRHVDAPAAAGGVNDGATAVSAGGAKVLHMRRNPASDAQLSQVEALRAQARRDRAEMWARSRDEIDARSRHVDAARRCRHSSCSSRPRARQRRSRPTAAAGARGRVAVAPMRMCARCNCVLRRRSCADRSSRFDRTVGSCVTRSLAVALSHLTSAMRRMCSMCARICSVTWQVESLEKLNDRLKKVRDHHAITTQSAPHRRSHHRAISPSSPISSGVQGEDRGAAQGGDGPHRLPRGPPPRVAPLSPLPDVRTAGGAARVPVQRAGIQAHVLSASVWRACL